MNHFDGVLKMYADAGMRTVEDWAKAGRAITTGAKSCATAPLRGGEVMLYTRDQTENRPSKRVPRISLSPSI
jgi:hypothetical protein